jgi:glycosyltransferase involved in cell wall biosynthesis
VVARTVPVSVVIPVLNEIDEIAECVGHLGWADEVIVADGGSHDGTPAAAARAGARVLESTGPTIAAQRNAGIASARNQWVFALDADERITEPLREELTAVLRAPSHQTYAVRRRNFYLGRELTRGHWGKDWVIRLFTRERRYVERRVHERLEAGPSPGRLNACLHHVPYRDLTDQLQKMNRYALWGAQDLYEQGERARVSDLTLRPCGRFLKAYFLQGSCWDGRFGLVTSLLGGYTAFLKYAHLWSIERRTALSGQRLQ